MWHAIIGLTQSLLEAIHQATPPLLSESDDLSSHNGLIEVSPAFLALSTLPLLGLAAVSFVMRLGLESPIVVGLIRTLVQLSILGAILHPIFYWGQRRWYVVAAYVAFMIVLAAGEATARSRYYFAGMLECVLSAIVINIGLISVIAFGGILRPTPVWNPQYVIPIIGMLLGNCINGVALSTNATLSALKEHANEIETYLCFGASPQEASARLLREAVRVGAMPGLNSMAVIGIISIPGMMTGQILGGSSPMQAAVYQMLITILIATSTFSTILMIAWMIIGIGFDADGMLRTDRFLERPRRLSFLERLAAVWQSLSQGISQRWHRYRRRLSRDWNGELQHLQVVSSASSDYVAPKGTLTVSNMRPGSLLDSGNNNNNNNHTDTTTTPKLQVCRLSRSVGEDRRVLFQDLSFATHAGDLWAVRGPSGVGKSQLLRLIAGLSPMDERSDLLLSGISRLHYRSMAQWRRQLRYVSQSKLDLPGTPRQFVQYVAGFNSWKTPPSYHHSRRSTLSRSLSSSGSMTSLPPGQSFRSSTDSAALSQTTRTMPTWQEMMTVCFQLVQQWGLDASCMDAEWKSLSGGESQRVHVAIALASQPQVLLLDEATSALDLDSKLRVEQSIATAAAETGMSVLLITHDADQVERLKGRYAADAEAPVSRVTL